MFNAANRHEYKYDLPASKFQKAFIFLERDNLAQPEPQWIGLGEGVRESIQRYDSWYCGVCSHDGLPVAVPYNGVDEITFYDDHGNYGKFFLEADDYIVLGPEDVHKPRRVVSNPMPIKKAVAEVPV